MSVTRTSNVRHTSEHFLPDDSADPQAQRRLRGQLEQIDYTAYASNREVIGHALGATNVQKFQRLGVAAAAARACWVAYALAATESGHPPAPEQVEKLAQLRRTYEELTEVYEAMRRMVERGYLPYASPPG
jgi:long-subunit acyl-CoA synthetase (AMP-forming)